MAKALEKQGRAPWDEHVGKVFGRKGVSRIFGALFRVLVIEARGIERGIGEGKDGHTSGKSCEMEMKIVGVGFIYRNGELFSVELFRVKPRSLVVASMPDRS